MEQRVLEEVHKSWLCLETKKQQIEVARKAVDQAEESLRIVENRYKTGLTIITELLDIETAVKQAQLELVQSLYDYQLAWVDHRYAAGLLDGDGGGTLDNER